MTVSPMEKYQLKTICGSSDILLNERFEKLPEYIGNKKAVILTDERVYELYGEHFGGFPVIRIPQGEQEKSLGRAALVYQELMRRGVDRSTLLVAVGGGVICDLGGFVATTYQRGIGLGFVPTTLLAQTDASIGGKNGINLGEYKNMVGTFRQPSFILIDPDFLTTLPEDEFISGLAEVVKYGLIRDKSILDMLENHLPENIFRDNELLIELIKHSVRVKIDVVEQDETDQDLRRILNFGHTYGHGIERLYNLSHGRAVGYGMAVALDFSVRLGLLNPAVKERAVQLFKILRLLPDINPDHKKVMQLIVRDKKRRGEKIPFVLLEDTGKCVVKPLSVKNIEELLNRAGSLTD